MKNNSIRPAFLVIFSLFLPLYSFAIEPIQVQIDQKVPQGKFSMGSGSPLTMKIPNSKRSTSKTVDGIFLGRVIEPSGSFSQFMLLDQTNDKVYFASRENVQIPRSDYQLFLKPYDQIGGTCTGYAIDHYFQQMYWAGFKGDGTLKTELSTEKGRTQLLVDSINEYYLVLKHHFSLVGVMNKLGSRFQFKCKMKKFEDANDAVSFLKASTNRGTPVMISFYIGPHMAIAPFELTTYEDEQHLFDNRLWLPRKKGERKSGGHSVVAASFFETKGRPMMLMLDSDWSEPRIWDVNQVFTEKTEMSEIEFITCQ